MACGQKHDNQLIEMTFVSTKEDSDSLVGTTGDSLSARVIRCHSQDTTNRQTDRRMHTHTHIQMRWRKIDLRGDELVILDRYYNLS